MCVEDIKQHENTAVYNYGRNLQGRNLYFSAMGMHSMIYSTSKFELFLGEWENEPTENNQFHIILWL